MSILKLGILGLSEGNGHPYSWSAIFNGYNKKLMSNCPFAGIPVYLSKQKFPEDAIPDAQVTHIWTQDLKLSQKIADTTYIDHVVKDYQDMIGDVDAILLARDDAENHYQFAKPFLGAGLPIYIDKLLAPTVKESEELYRLQRYDGQIFTGSALAYASEFEVFDQLDTLGDLLYVDACVMKEWSTYGIHIVDPVLRLLNKDRKIVSIHAYTKNDKSVRLNYDDGLQVNFTAMRTTNVPISIRLFGSNDYLELKFSDTFFAFKSALATFISVIKGETTPPSKDFILQTVKVIEEGGRNAK